jgi:hypothetical protein
MSERDKSAEARTSAIRAAVQKYMEALVEYGTGERLESQGNALVEEGRSRKKIAQEQYGQLIGMATLFNFDLKAEFEAEISRQTQFREVDAPPQNALEMASTADTPKRTVKDHVIDAARQAYPNPIRASALRRQLEATGIGVHEKTIGMTLYRLSRVNMLRRDGWDWFWVPEGERKPSQDAENPGDDPGLFNAAE